MHTMNSTSTQTSAWRGFLKNFLTAVALGLLIGATISTLDYELLDNGVQETHTALDSAVSYLP